jgi:hypothetical protein
VVVSECKREKTGIFNTEDTEKRETHKATTKAGHRR